MKCANYNCNNDLTDYDIRRHTHKYNKWRLCISCRKKVHRITNIKCVNCNKLITLDKQKLYCELCALNRKNEMARKRHHMGYVKTTKYHDIISGLLDSGEYVKMNDICDITGMESRKLFPHIAYMRNKGLNIVTYYRLE